eukprot:TRINITY_DN6479_c0_g1_i3.p1 TRINITY_DN6479_c0_g1~~TRINITY_DN6479_c0_g1_i3.p1  ORF type:complete len:340 (+),score=71.36 TRINITY_DN6479_c0_g1_i3:383-1402(+)
MWFKRHKGLITGVSLFFFANSVLVFAWLTGKIMNPDNLPATIRIEDGVNVSYIFDKRVAERFPMTLMILSGVYLVIVIIGLLLISVPEKDPVKATPEYQADKKRSLIEKALSNDQKAVDSLIKREEFIPFYKTIVFWLLFIMGFGGSLVPYFSVNSYKTYGLIIINDDNFMSLVGSIGGLTNGIGRLFWGFVSDKLTFRQSFGWIALIQLVFIASFSLIETKPLYAIWYGMMQFAAGGFFTVFGPEVSSTFGTKRGPKVFSFISGGAWQLSTLMNVAIGKWLVQLWGYQIIFFGLAGGTFIVLAVDVMLYKRKIKKKDRQSVLSILEQKKEEEIKASLL